MPTRIKVFAGFLLAVLIVFPQPAQAQERQGVWVGAGAGYGSADANCDECDSDSREAVRTAYVTAGWTVTPRVRLGGEFHMWGSDAASLAPNVETRLRIYDAAATVTFYPRVSSGLFIRGGAGASFVNADFGVGQSTVAPDLGKGLALAAAAGYDVRLGPRVFLTPAVHVRLGRVGELQTNGDTFVSGWQQNVVEFTIGLTFD